MKSGKKEDVIEKAVSFLKSGNHKELVKYCNTVLKSEPFNAEIWKLQGVAYGSLGNPKKARGAFLKALGIDSKDEMTLANYITACFHDQDLPSAAEGIDLFYDNLEPTGKSAVLDSVMEAIKDGVVEKSNLPSSIKKLLSAKNTSDKSVKIIYKEVKEVSTGHGYLVHGSSLVHGASSRDITSSAVAFIDGYKFENSKITVVEILNEEGTAWNFYEGGYSKTHPMLVEAIEELAVSTLGKFLGLKPPPIKYGFKLLGGF